MGMTGAVSLSSSPSKRAVNGIVSHYQNHINDYQNSGSIRNIPVCHKCARPMKLEWNDSATGTKQLWYCDVCFHYRIAKPYFTI